MNRSNCIRVLYLTLVKHLDPFLLFSTTHRNLKQEQIQIHFNLVVAIAIAQLTFLCGVDFSESKVRQRSL